MSSTKPNALPPDAETGRALRILLLILQFPPDVNSTGLLMAQLGQGLRARGHQVSVLTSFPHYEHFRVWDSYRGKLAQHGDYKGMDVLRLWVYASGTKQRMLHRLLSYLSFCALSTIAGVLSRRRYDVILCTNGSFFSGISAFVIGRVHRTPFVYNVQDLYPETPVAAGQLHNKRAIAILEKLERFMYRVADHVSVITPAFRANLLAKGVPADKVAVIPNFVDTQFIQPLPKDNEFARAHGLADTFVVTHAGNVGYVYDLDTMLEAAALLSEHRDIRFLIVGDGVAKPGLQRKAQALGLSNVQFLPFQPHESLPWLRAASDVQVSLYRARSAHYSMPSKIYEIMASGRPLLASAAPGTDVWNLVAETGCGICVEPGDPQALAAAVLRLHDDPTTSHAMAQRGLQSARERYSTPAVTAHYEALLRHVVSAAAQRADPDAGKARRTPSQQP